MYFIDVEIDGETYSIEYSTYKDPETGETSVMVYIPNGQHVSVTLRSGLSLKAAIRDTARLNLKHLEKK